MPLKTWGQVLSVILVNLAAQYGLYMFRSTAQKCEGSVFHILIIT